MLKGFAQALYGEATQLTRSVGRSTIVKLSFSKPQGLNMKIFLTGGTGFIGQSLTKRFVARDWQIVALIRKPDSPQAHSLTKMGVQCVTGDITDRESMRVPMQSADIVVHNAGHYELGVNKAGKQRMHEVNITGTDNVLGLAQELGVPRTIYVSTVIAMGDTAGQLRDETFIRRAPCWTAYEQSKTTAHQLALQFQQHGLPLIIVCPNAVVGPNDHSVLGYLLRLYLNRMLPPLGWSPNTIQGYVEVNDLAEGIALTAEKGRIGETYIFSGEFQSIRDVFKHWSKKPGAFKGWLWLPNGLASLLVTPLEPLQRRLGLPAFISRDTVLGAATNLYYSSEKAKQELGWTPRCAEAVWNATIDGELELRSRRKGQNLVQRLKPLDTVD
jgi:dihydroflavonol-4-reductase